MNNMEREFLYKKTSDALSVLLEKNGGLYELRYTVSNSEPLSGLVISKVKIDSDLSLIKRTMSFGEHVSQQRFDEMVEASSELELFEDNKEYLLNKYMY